MTLGLKHYDLYSVEVPRPSFIPNVTAHDLWETYLPQYRLGFSNKDPDGAPAGGAMGTMCSYAGLNGVPSWCAHALPRAQALVRPGAKSFARQQISFPSKAQAFCAVRSRCC